MVEGRIHLEAEGRSQPFFDPIPPILASGATRWPGIALEEYALPTGGFPDRTVFRSHIIGVLESATPLTQYWQENGVEHRAPMITGEITLRSQQELKSCRWDQAATMLILGIESTSLSDILGDIRGPAAREFVPKPVAQDPVLRHLILALREDLASGSPAGSLVGECIASAIAAQAFQRHGSTSLDLGSYRGGIPAERLRRVQEYIDAYLAGDLRIAQLARIAGMGSYHFATLFKSSTGSTVHQYVLKARIRKAQALLRRDDESIVAVAAAVGFPNQSHFTDLFHRRTGRTPAEWRRSRV